MKLKKCCSCLSLRTGVTIISVFLIVGSIILMLISLKYLMNRHGVILSYRSYLKAIMSHYKNGRITFMDRISAEEATEFALDHLVAFSIAYLTMAVMMTITSLLLLAGALGKFPCLLIPWLTSAVIFIITTGVLQLWLTHNMAIYVEYAMAFISSWLVASIVLAYFIIVTVSLHHELTNSDQIQTVSEEEPYNEVDMEY